MILMKQLVICLPNLEKINILEEAFQKKKYLVITASTSKEENTLTFEVKVAESDMGKVIGRQGRLAKSIRTVAKSVGAREHKKVSVEFID